MTALSSSSQIVTNFLNADLADFCQWCGEHKMIVNIPKTKANFIGQKHTVHKIIDDPPVWTLDGQMIEISNCEKLHCVYVDNTLS